MNNVIIKTNPIEAIVNCIIESVSYQVDPTNRIITECKIAEYESFYGMMWSVVVTSECDGWAEETNKHLFSFDKYQITFTAEELIGLTEKTAKDLYKSRDEAFFRLGSEEVLNRPIKAMILDGLVPSIPRGCYAEIISTGSIFLPYKVDLEKDEIEIAYSNRCDSDRRRLHETFKLSSFINEFKVYRGWSMYTNFQ